MADIEAFYIGRKCTIKDSGSPKIYEVAGFHECGDIMLSFDRVILTSKKFSPDRLELLPLDRSRPGSEADKKNSDYRPIGDVLVHPDESIEWFAFVMLQAGALFQNVPSPPPPDLVQPAPSGMQDTTREELKRLILARGESETGPILAGALGYYDAALKWYQDDAERYDD